MGNCTQYMEEEENCSTCQHFKGIGIACTRRITTMSPYNLICNSYKGVIK